MAILLGAVVGITVGFTVGSLIRLPFLVSCISGLVAIPTAYILALGFLLVLGELWVPLGILLFTMALGVVGVSLGVCLNAAIRRSGLSR